MTSLDTVIDWRFGRARAYERAMYARLAREGTELESYPATRPGAVLFVDLHVGENGSDRIEDVVAAVEQLRELSPAGLGNVSTVLFRWPQLSEGPNAIEECDLERVWEGIGGSLQNMRMAATAGLVCAPLGAQPSITWGPESLAPADRAGPSGDTLMHNWKRWLLACREVELTALLQNGRGIWRPRHYHYRLPSGRHSGTFVRLGDAIRSVRDAEVLAWWLHEHAVENVGVVLDTSTIVPIILALRNSMAKNDLILGRIESLASYPATQLEFTSSVGRARSGDRPVLALLSVNSSGSVRDRLLDALGSTESNEAADFDAPGLRRPWALHTFVDKMGNETYHLDKTRVDCDQQTSVWSNHGENTEMVAERCELCNDLRQSRTVQIDPKSFDGLVLPDPVLVTPDIRIADAARVFWHLCDKTRALSFDDEPHPSVSTIRPHGKRMGVVIDYDSLLGHEAIVTVESVPEQPTSGPSEEELDPIAELTAAVIDQLHQQRRQNDEHGWISSRRAIDFVEAAQLIVGLDGEFQRAEGGGKELVQSVVSSWDSDAEIVGFNIENGHHNAQLESSVADVDTTCIFVLGVVTGTSLHRALTWIQEVRRRHGREPCDVGVFALHLRPASWRAREVILNPFGRDRVVAVFESVFPDGPSPLDMERRLIDSYADLEQVNSLPYYRRRRKYLRREAESSVDGEQPESAFWGLRPESEIARLRPGSLFGERLTATATLMAVGSGIQRQRHHDRALGEIPEWRQFEIPAIFASYFDPLIVCSIMRWLEKEECWWGREITRSDDVIQSLLKQYTKRAERAVLLSELLLAAAMGKVPKKAVEVIVDSSKGLIGEAMAADHDGDGEVDVEALELGLALVAPQNAPVQQVEAEDATGGTGV